jgi:hypothetical protein
MTKKARAPNYVGNVVDVVWHRNGVSGHGFHSVLFQGAKGTELEGQQLVATVFDVEVTSEDEPTGIERLDGVVAVLNVSEIVMADIGGRFRGDRFEADLREAIRVWREEADADYTREELDAAFGDEWPKEGGGE